MKTRNRLTLLCLFYVAAYMSIANTKTVNADFRSALTKGAELKALLIVEDDEPSRLVQYKGVMDVPATNEWIGLDLEKKDFVKPYGKGEISDFEIKVEWDGLPAWKSQYCSLDLRFAGTHSGGYYENNVMESEFPYPYRADLDNAFLERVVHIIDRAGISNKTNIPFPKDKSLVIRSRVVVDENEHIINAYYGCIRKLGIGPSRRGKALLVLSYVFNQISNDTNLEALER